MFGEKGRSMLSETSPSCHVAHFSSLPGYFQVASGSVPLSSRSLSWWQVARVSNSEHQQCALGQVVSLCGHKCLPCRVVPKIQAENKTFDDSQNQIQLKQTNKQTNGEKKNLKRRSVDIQRCFLPLETSLNYQGSENTGREKNRN